MSRLQAASATEFKPDEYAVTTSDHIVLGDSSGGSIDLPCQQRRNWQELVIKHVGSANNVVIKPNGNNVDESGADITLATQYDYRRLFFDEPSGSHWL